MPNSERLCLPCRLPAGRHVALSLPSLLHLNGCSFRDLPWPSCFPKHTQVFHCIVKKSLHEGQWKCRKPTRVPQIIFLVFPTQGQADSCLKDVDEESDGGHHWKSQICLGKRGLSENTLIQESCDSHVCKRQ